MSYPIFQTKHTAAHSISIGSFLNFKNSLFQYININIETMMMDMIALPTSPTVRVICSTNGNLIWWGIGSCGGGIGSWGGGGGEGEGGQRNDICKM